MSEREVEWLHNRSSVWCVAATNARYADLLRHPAASVALTRLARPEFDGLWAEVGPRLAAAERKRLIRPTRKRRIGAEHPSALTGRDRVLLTVIWLRRNPIYDVAELLFGVSPDTALRTVHRILPHLDAAGQTSMRPRDTGQYRRPHLDDLLLTSGLPEHLGPNIGIFG